MGPGWSPTAACLTNGPGDPKEGLRGTALMRLRGPEPPGRGRLFDWGALEKPSLSPHPIYSGEAFWGRGNFQKDWNKGRNLGSQTRRRVVAGLGTAEEEVVMEGLARGSQRWSHMAQTWHFTENHTHSESWAAWHLVSLPRHLTFSILRIKS